MKYTMHINSTVYRWNEPVPQKPQTTPVHPIWNNSNSPITIKDIEFKF